MGLMQSINACAVPRTSQNVKLKGLVAGVGMQMFWTWGITDIYIFLGIIVFFSTSAISFIRLFIRFYLRARIEV